MSADKPGSEFVTLARDPTSTDHFNLYPECGQEDSHLFLRIDFVGRKESHAISGEVSRVDADQIVGTWAEWQGALEPEKSMGADLQTLIRPLVVGIRSDLASVIEIARPLDGQLDFPVR